MTYRPFTVVAAPYRYVERPVVKRRPCVLLTAPMGPLELVWALMITGAGKAAWPGDVAVTDIDVAGLRGPCVIRCAKVATLQSDVLTRIGQLSDADRQAVTAAVQGLMPWPGPGH
ncbi:type II toxin-antitoxin system PemK/MazF family toxin [Caenispirillum salinarum]|uniref:type II toxin-antitoxin system PemK/MazF family toxin n=1 Tax=Caenispirillum salinarum TaxID=859058 RepID=UPI0038513C0F